jgi:hypothetical protein
VTIDEELTLLESQLRRLKIEYEVFFSNPTKKAPTDVEWKVLSLLRKFSDGGGRTTFSQRYRYNAIAQRYAIYSDLWRKKARIREEGYRRPQDALLSVQGVRPEDHEREHKVYGVSQAALAAVAGAVPAAAGVTPVPAKADQPFAVECSDARVERDKVEKLFKVLTDAKRNAGEEVSGSVENFTAFVQKKTDQIRKQYGCHSVEYTVEIQDGQVRLKAKAKV